VDNSSVSDYGFRLMSPAIPPAVNREILPAFWKIQILHHAAQEPMFGPWIVRELRRHGYHVSGRMLYPLPARMKERGWLAERPFAFRPPEASR
jgi:hypothetical protein